MDNMGEIEIKIKVPAARIADLLECAYNGGIGYWCRVMEYVEPTDGRRPYATSEFGEFPLYGGAVVCRLFEEETDDEYKPLRLDQTAIERGLALFPVECPQAWADFVMEREDCNAGDLFVQLCLLGHIVYG